MAITIIYRDQPYNLPNRFRGIKTGNIVNYFSSFCHGEGGSQQGKKIVGGISEKGSS